MFENMLLYCAKNVMILYFQKVHCSGRITRTPDLTTKANLLHVILLFCQPFMLTGNDFTHDVKQNVFWSKHDMDLTIRELDKK